ncbi:MAG: tetratricopeptide repeat protein [Spirochaetes bacterium]|nr:tetratricopeptide repeat protein [Spirochaetota bacterium]
MSFLLPIVIVSIILMTVFLIGFFVIVAPTRKGNSRNRKVKVKDRAQILKEANRRLAQNPKDAIALQSIGELYYSEQNWEKACSTYALLSEISAGNPEMDEFEINMRYGVTAIKLDKFEEAYRALFVAHTFKQDNFEVNFNLGYLDFQKRQYEKAVALLKQAATQNPDHAGALRYLGLSLFKTKAYRDSLNAIRRALDVAPDDKEAIFALGECYYELGQADQAIRVFTHLRADPQFGPNAALFAGTIHLNQHQYQKAIMDLEIGLKHPNIKVETMVELKYRLSAAYLHDQEISKAVTILAEIQSVYPNYKDVPSLLSKYRELNSNRNLQTFLLAPASDFITLCRKVVMTFFPKAKIKITNIAVQRNDYADILAEIETTKWSDIVEFRFIRSSGTVGELMVRDFHASLKDTKAGKGYVISAGSYSDEARKFVEARLIDLVDKDALTKMLNSIDMKARTLLDE